MFSVSELIKVTRGRLIGASDKEAEKIFISDVSKDTREIGRDNEYIAAGNIERRDTKSVKVGSLYVAIKGERFDGHDFCTTAVEKGAAALLVSDSSKVPDGSVAIEVKDTVIALGEIARAYRMKIGAKVICVTGSVGKTSTREMIVQALKPSFKVFSTRANQNNEIGLPMTILEAPDDTEILVLEMGMRLRGEISYLTNIACPDIAVITNVGYSHIERLGSREEIRLAKMEIAEGLTDGGILAVNADDDFLSGFAKDNLPEGKKLACIAAKETQYAKELCKDNATASKTMFADGVEFDADINAGDIALAKNVKLSVAGVHHVRNSLFALLCTALTGGDIDKAAASLGEYTEMKGRGHTVKTDLYTVINDAYNASPESMEAAFFNLDALQGGRKIAVLGGILELGDFAPELHEKVGRDCGKYSFDHVFVTGDNVDSFVKGLLGSDKNASYTICKDKAETGEKLKAFVRKGDILLFKASHAFGFEALAEEFIAEASK